MASRRRRASTLKHFAAYSVPKGGRDGNARTDPHIAPRELYQIYLYPSARVQEAGALAMSSVRLGWRADYRQSLFSTELLAKIRLHGYVVSDSRAVEFDNKHHVAGDYKEAVRQVMEAGLDVRMISHNPQIISTLQDNWRKKEVSMKKFDQRVANV